MSTAFYKKVGKKYIQVSEYDYELTNSLNFGNHLVSIFPGGSSRRAVDPAFAPMIAAGRYSRNAVADAIVEASALRPVKAPLTDAQRKAWENLNEALGEEVRSLQYSSAYEIAGKAVDAMVKEADILLSHPAVKNAYDEFMLICKLVKEENVNT